MGISELPVVKVLAQHGQGDCCITALAMLTGLSYDDVLEAASSVLRKPHRRGMYVSQILATAAVLHLPLVKRRRFDPEHDTGILTVYCRAGRTHSNHVVLLRWGLIFDTADCEVWEYGAFMAQYAATPKTLLVRREQ